MLCRKVTENTIQLTENNIPILIITEQINEDVIVFNINGTLKNNLVYELEDELSAAVSVKKNMELDFSQLSYIASASLKMLLRIQQKLDASNSDKVMKITHVPDNIMQVFREVGLSDLLQFEKGE